MLNTVHGIPTCSSVDTDSRYSPSNRFCALETTPVLRIPLYTLDREFSCPENGGGYRNLSSMGKRVSDTQWDYPTDKVGGHGYCTNMLQLPDQANQLQQQSRHGNKPDRAIQSRSMMSSQKDIPVALRTRSKAHQKDTVCMIANEAPHQSQLEMETKDLILLRLIKQADELHIDDL